MPSLVDFSPLLEAQREKNRMEQASQQTRSALVQQGLQTVALGIEQAGEIGRGREREFQSMFDYDLNKIANKEARGYLVSRYNQIKRDGLRTFKENKNFLGYGKLSPEQRIEIEDQLDSFAREAHLLNVVNEQIGNAEKLKADRPTAIKVDNEAIGKYLELLKPNESGKYDIEGMAKFLSETRKSPTGQAFTNYADWDAEENLRQSVMPIQKEVGPTKQDDTIITDKNGKRYSTTYETTSYGTEPQRRTLYFQMLNNSKNADQYNYQIGTNLTEEERTEAIAKYGGKELNPYSAYWAYDKADLNKGFEPRKLIKSTKQMPKTEDEGTVRTRNFKQLLDQEGKPIETMFGIQSPNFVDYSLQSPNINELENFILPKSAEEIVIGQTPKAGMFGIKGSKDKVPEPKRASATGIGKPDTYRIVGHDKDKGEFWLVQKSGKVEAAPEGADIWSSTKGKPNYLDHIIIVPESDIIPAFMGTYKPQTTKPAEALPNDFWD